MAEAGKDAGQQTDEFTDAIAKYHDSLEELDRLRSQKLRRTLSQISLFFHDRLSKEASAESSLSNKETRIFELLKQEAGYYPLSDLTRITKKVKNLKLKATSYLVSVGLTKKLEESSTQNLRWTILEW